MILLLALALQQPDLVLADFEGETYGAWRASGDCFGDGPARGTLSGQQPVSGFLGKGLVNTYLRGDATKGTLASPDFKVERKFLTFLVGGGRHPETACVNLIVDGMIVRTATGRNEERLARQTWDVSEFAGKEARIEVVDREGGAWGHLNVDQIVLCDREPDERAELLAQAEESVRRAAERVKDDPARPTYHVMAPAQWVNDPNGPLFHDGWYHLFYQHNPYGDGWGHMHWGHVRSRDLAHWEHQPIALWPSKSKGEDHVFSGSAAVTKKGGVVLFYTSIGPRDPEQWAALPEDKDLVLWKKHPANPILSMKDHGGTRVHEWRDPYFFRSGDRAYLVCGGNLNASKGGEAVVLLYRSDDDDLAKWTYAGVLWKHPDVSAKNIECPLFFKVGAKWVLIVSPHRLPEYFTGDFDEKAGTFKAEQRGIVDPGHYYAPSACEDGQGRRLLWGWVNGFPAGKGWRHCLTLPRVLSVGPAGELLQSPAPELAKLRGEKRTELGRFESRAAEIVFDVEPGAARSGIRIGKTEVAFEGGKLDVAGKVVDLRTGSATVRVFWDRTLLEVYAAGGRVALSRVIELPEPAVEAFGAPKSLEAWPLQSAWK